MDERSHAATSRGAVRAAVHRGWRWLLLDGNRVTVAAVAVLVGFFLTGVVGFEVFSALFEEGVHRPTTPPLVGALLSGNLLLFSIVVSINALFVTQESAALEREHGRVQSVVDYRRELETALDVDHVPAAPTEFVRLLSGEILALAQEIDGDLRTAELDLRADLDRYVSSLAAETGAMNETLETAESNADLVIAMIGYNHDRQINDLRRLRSTHREALPDETMAAIDDLLELLQYFASARSYFKSLYIRQEFATLSRNLVFISVVAVATTATFMHYLDLIPPNHLLVTGVEAVALAPFLLVGSYVLRVSAGSRRTQAAGQFVVSDDVTGEVEGISRAESERRTGSDAGD